MTDGADGGHIEQLVEVVVDHVVDDRGDAVLFFGYIPDGPPLWFAVDPASAQGLTDALEVVAKAPVGRRLPRYAVHAFVPTWAVLRTDDPE